MLKKIWKTLKTEIKENYKYYLTLIIFLLVINIKLDYYIYSPGSLVELTDRIETDNEYVSKGSFNLTYVTARNGTLLNLLVSFIMPNWDIEKISDNQIENESTKDINERGKVLLKETSYDAIIAAFKEANLEYEIKNLSLSVLHVYEQANTTLKVGDTIKTINGVNVTDTTSFRKEINKYKANDTLKFTVLRNDKVVDAQATLFDSEGTTVIGILVTELKDVETNPKVEYVFKNSESGSSRGLMCALEIYNRITDYDLTRGLTIAGTGTIDENGNVGAIDGIKYKIIGAVKKGSDVFIAPEENYEEALKIINENNYDIKLIKATTLSNVIEDIKNLDI